MGKFKFKLEKVLDIRLREENEINLEYTKLLNEKNKLSREKIQLKETYDIYANKKYDDINMIKIKNDYIISVSNIIEKLDEKISEKEKEIDEVKSRFLEKQIERKSLEKLKEKKLSIYTKEEELKEQNINDEFAIYSYFARL